MSILVVLAGLALIQICLWEAFETIILPRRVSRRFRLTRYFYRDSWRAFTWAAGRTSNSVLREGILSFYGPLSLILLIALWALGLILGFALLHSGLGTDMSAPEGMPHFGSILYHSGVTFFTLGFGDIAPRDPLGRLIAVLEAGTGFGFLAVVIGYLPVFYQAFSHREVTISLMDARAGSPPCGTELLRRHAIEAEGASLDGFLQDWERWSAEVLESHLSYPLLAYFRSQHDRESWVTSLTAVLDACALLMVGIDGCRSWQARLTFAMARHAAADLTQIFYQPPLPPDPDRLPPERLQQLRKLLAGAGLRLVEGQAAERELARLRAQYEPYVNALAQYLQMNLPDWLPEAGAQDDWQTTAWEQLT